MHVKTCDSVRYQLSNYITIINKISRSVGQEKLQTYQRTYLTVTSSTTLWKYKIHTRHKMFTWCLQNLVCCWYLQLLTARWQEPAKWNCWYYSYICAQHTGRTLLNRNTLRIRHVHLFFLAQKGSTVITGDFCYHKIILHN